MNSGSPRMLYYNPLLTDRCWDVGSFRTEETLLSLADVGVTGIVASPRLDRRGRIGGAFDLLPLPKSPMDRAKSLLRIALDGDFHFIQERFHGGDVISNGYGLMVSARTGIPLVSELHNIGVPLSLVKTLHFLPLSLIRSEAVLLYSAPLGYSVLAAGGSRFIRVPNGFSKRLVDSIRGRERAIFDLEGKSGNRMVFGYFGGLTAAKGVSLILDAARLLENDRRLCFAFAGRGAMEHRLVRQAASSDANVLFLGLLSREETLACMSQCRATFAVHDAYQSRLGNSVKVVESVAVDVPAIVHSSLEMPSDLHAGCIRIDERTPRAIADSVCALIDAPKRKVLCSKVHEFSIERIVQRVLYPVYLDLIR